MANIDLYDWTKLTKLVDGSHFSTHSTGDPANIGVYCYGYEGNNPTANPFFAVWNGKSWAYCPNLAKYIVIMGWLKGAHFNNEAVAAYVNTLEFKYEGGRFMTRMAAVVPPTIKEPKPPIDQTVYKNLASYGKF